MENEQKTRQGRGWQPFLVNVQIVNILGFGGHQISVLTNQLCYCVAQKHPEVIRKQPGVAVLLYKIGQPLDWTAVSGLRTYVVGGPSWK